MSSQTSASCEAALQYAFTVAGYGDPRSDGAMRGNDAAAFLGAGRVRGHGGGAAGGAAITGQMEWGDPPVRVSIS